MAPHIEIPKPEVPDFSDDSTAVKSDDVSAVLDKIREVLGQE